MRVKCDYLYDFPPRIEFDLPSGKLGYWQDITAVCVEKDSLAHCKTWTVEYTQPWFPDQNDYFELLPAGIRLPSWDTLTCQVENRGLEFGLGLRGGKVTAAYVVHSEPTGASLYLNGVDTGRVTRDTVFVVDWWSLHTVRVELAGYRPDSVVLGPLYFPTCNDSFGFFLKPLAAR